MKTITTLEENISSIISNMVDDLKYYKDNEQAMEILTGYIEDLQWSLVLFGKNK